MSAKITEDTSGDLITGGVGLTGDLCGGGLFGGGGGGGGLGAAEGVPVPCAQLYTFASTELSALTLKE